MRIDLGIGVASLPTRQGGGGSAPPAGFAFLIDSTGKFLVDRNGTRLIGRI